MILASRANNKGSVSPIGLAVAMFPAIVQTFLIWTDPYLFKTSEKSGKYFFINNSNFINGVEAPTSINLLFSKYTNLKGL